MWAEQNVREDDQEYFEAEQNELKRINESLELIPSENFPSRDVLHALGSIFNNKYAEGYPSKRYYGGNEFIDIIENLAIDRAKKLFGAEHVNVQPYSGSPANIAVYFALLEPGEVLMGMNLAMGGHLTHGHPVNFSGKMYKSVQYSVDPKTHLIDYDEVMKMAKKEKPKIIVSGATAYPRVIDFKRFSEIAQETGAISMADIAHIAGLIAGGVHPSPFPFTDIVTTTTHKTLRGPRGAMIMCKQEFAEKIDKAVFPGLQGGPHEHVIAAKAVAFKEALKPDFREYAKQIVKNAKALAESMMANGLTLVSGGTDNHLILVDLRDKNVSGKEAEQALDKAGITVNKNTIPYDPRKPWDPSGIRLGTPTITTRGMKETEMEAIGELIAKAIDNVKNETELSNIRKKVKDLCSGFPVY
ncbi:MAG: serine hydroxymethyltransferase [Candidatus Aenigmarchaeota archaeon]|nr:serine hydroxymethyltransferase [Candidatus Aenigmarchaeota archaeon]